MTVIMDGKKLAQEVKAELKQRVEELWTSKQIVPLRNTIDGVDKNGITFKRTRHLYL